MNNYKMIIQYDGGRYRGWQRLGNGDSSIQGKIENVLTEMAGEEVQIIGCSRTDAGVHAMEQIANFKIKTSMSELQIKAYLNKYLPNDISVLHLETVPDRFHARYNAKDKTYLYKIWNEEHTNPFMRKYSMHVDQKLDISNMKEAASHFLGSHDFTAYSNAKSKKKSMVREIYAISIEKENGFLHIRVRGDGFLYNMVRKIVGTLIEVGLNTIKPDQIPAIIESKERVQTGLMAEAAGLYLEKVEF
ncbi:MULTISPECIES: tRNA pseudouridine(38-40) synthase TruA [Bacillaceae]|uniref:tRNA pseudouridine(38-40) synthase TruA n=1 Tax=Bacillaceae TaxID=186817 RepID=UPI001E361B76|nr:MULTISPECIES: tRNA pseudouridine(38-40) synthase TruA [Bacillaceae]MCE4050865.1 tRNA pseudouridine(38-40) synthase TruA [Bacillus sp. Au-Bac7]MDL0436497.1 tRNA pseudouridine(38-40) synthase TruA [Niallia sp. SS-2023]UPO88612.1 tRNA pseudouridine(38-40) synthase TruA [Niallia sp. Man26]